MATPEAEVEALKATVARHFSVYGVVVTPFALTFQVTSPAESLDASFDALRQELVPRNYIPSIVRERGETLVHVQRRPTTRFARREVNAGLLIVTILTTIFFGGAWNWADYAGKALPGALLDLEALGMGAVFFSLPLLTILGAHEMGHYVVAKRHRVHASLPFFLPSVPPLGTFGAFISMRDPIPNRKALLDIGISGPLVGFAIAIPVAIAGLALSSAAPQAGEAPEPSLLFAFLSQFFPLPADYRMHPLAFAGWVGLFVTAINLLPAGQLDGGHVARALLGSRQHYLSWAAVLALFAMGTFYFGWVIFGFLILMLGVRHPPPLNDLTDIGPLRKLIGVAAVAILVLTFIPQPFAFAAAQADFRYEDLQGEPLADGLVVDIAVGGSAVARFAVNNTGTVRETIGLRIHPQNLDQLGWTINFTSATIIQGSKMSSFPVGSDNVTFVLNATERAILEIGIVATSWPGTRPAEPTFLVIGRIDETGLRHELDVTVRVA